MVVTPLARRRLLTVACALLIGQAISTCAAILLVPARLPVEYLTPLTLSGPSLGLIVGAVLAQRTSPERPH